MSSEDDYKALSKENIRRLILVAAGAGLILLITGIVILTGWINGTGTVFQTSTLSEMGVCLQDEVYNPQKQIPGGLNTIYICGQIDGKTKRYISFNLYFHNESRPVFGDESNLEPGVVFVPVNAEDLRYISISEFPAGEYRLDAAYSRDPFTSTVFSVGD